eukprot:1625357-Pleurochrysis_carterae.AAC.2
MPGVVGNTKVGATGGGETIVAQEGIHYDSAHAESEYGHVHLAERIMSCISAAKVVEPCAL